MKQVGDTDIVASNSLCQHPSFIIKETCTCCGKSKPECGNPTTVKFDYLTRGLSLTLDEINLRRDMDLQSLLIRKKLHLVLDLDNTLIHSVKSYKHALEEQANLHGICGRSYMVKLRPGALAFLKQVSAMFDLSIYTMGGRSYAEEVVRLLIDPDGSGLGLGSGSFEQPWRVISREDCTKKMVKRLDVVLSHERVVLVVDDKEEAWGDRYKNNVIKIAPYRYFVTKSTTFCSCGSRKTRWYCLSSEDESEENGELARVLQVLKKVHSTFYSGDSFNLGDDYGNKDVRQVLKRVDPMSSTTSTKASCDYKLEKMKVD